MAEGRVKKVGGSYAIFLPIEEAKRLQLSEGERVRVAVTRPMDRSLFGLAKGIDLKKVRRLLKEADLGG